MGDPARERYAGICDGADERGAVDEARELARDNRPSTVYVHYKREGEELKPVQEEYAYHE